MRLRRVTGVVLAAAAAVLLVAAAGCGPTAPVTPASGNEKAPDRDAQVGGEVSVGADGFTPRNVTIREGQSVVWRNEDRTKHNVGGSGLVSGPLGRGDTYTHAFDAPGVYQYICTFHPETEVGMVTVEPR